MNTAVKKNGLLFRQVRQDLENRIRTGEFVVGGQLPTEHALMEQYAVSITTVRKAVQQLADEGFVSKRQGQGTFVSGIPKPRGRAHARPQKIGVFLPDTGKLKADGDSRHWLLNVRRLNGIYASAAQRGAAVLVHGFGEMTDLSQLDGAICMPSYAYDLAADDLRRKLAFRLKAAKVPYVTVSEYDPRFAARYWVVELIESEFYRAVNYLLAAECTRIALLGPTLDWANPRYAAYRKALTNAGIGFETALVVENPLSDSRSAYRACEELISRLGGRQTALKKMDAVLCTTDLQAYGVLSCLRDMGIRVPEDLSVMGADNLPESESLPTPLTSMEFSGPAVGVKAFELLEEVLAGGHPGGVTVSCPGRICERATVKNKNTIQTISTYNNKNSEGE